MKILACYNIKGGVGKTTSAVNLSYLCAEKGWRTLIWDLDPQGAASFYFRVEPGIKKGAKGVVKNKRKLIEHIKGTNYPGLDLIPADFSYRNLDLHLENSDKPKDRFRELLDPLVDEYDFIFLDCAPSISLVSENIFHAADALLVPVIPTTLSLRTLKQLMDFIYKEDLSDLKILPFFTQVDRRKLLHRTILDNPPFQGELLMKAWVPYASIVEKMGIRRAPLPAYARYSTAAQAYMSLWDEISHKDQNC